MERNGEIMLSSWLGLVSLVKEDSNSDWCYSGCGVEIKKSFFSKGLSQSFIKHSCSIVLLYLFLNSKLLNSKNLSDKFYN